MTVRIQSSTIYGLIIDCDIPSWDHGDPVRLSAGKQEDRHAIEGVEFLRRRGKKMLDRIAAPRAPGSRGRQRADVVLGKIREEAAFAFYGPKYATRGSH